MNRSRRPRRQAPRQVDGATGDPLRARPGARFARLLAEAGDFARSAAKAEEARDLAVRQGTKELAAELAEKVKLYRSGAAFREKRSPK